MVAELTAFQAETLSANKAEGETGHCNASGHFQEEKQGPNCVSENRSPVTFCRPFAVLLEKKFKLP